MQTWLLKLFGPFKLKISWLAFGLLLGCTLFAGGCAGSGDADRLASSQAAAPPPAPPQTIQRIVNGQWQSVTVTPAPTTPAQPASRSSDSTRTTVTIIEPYAPCTPWYFTLFGSTGRCLGYGYVDNIFIYIGPSYGGYHPHPPPPRHR